jgi:tetratricopeptide (TPR) repeat protein
VLLVVLVPAAVSAYFLGVDPFWCAALLLVALWLLPKLYKEGVKHYLTRTAMKNRAAASPHMRRATDFFIKEDYDQAILEYSMAISIDRYSVSKYNLRGGLFSLQKQYDYAIVDYTSAINIAPKLRGLGSPISDNLMDTWASAYDGRGKAHFAKEEFDLAIDDLSNSIFYLHVLATVNLIDDDVSFGLSRAFDYRGRSYLAIGDYDSAVADFESSLRFELHDSDDSIVRRADQHYECEEYDSAITGYTLAIHIDPDFAGDYNKRGLAYLAKYEYDSAIADFETAISISPHFDEMIYENRDKAHRSKENSGSGK